MLLTKRKSQKFNEAIHVKLNLEEVPEANNAHIALGAHKALRALREN